MGKTRIYSVPAMEKGLDLLEALAGSAVPLSLVELSRDLGKGSSELFRMLNCLEQRGYIARDGLSGKYTLTLRLYQLAHTHSPVDKLLAAAREPMRGLTHALSESCHLSVLYHHQLLVVAQELSPEKLRLSVEVGSIHDARKTASGQLLLAQGSADPPDSIIAKDETIEGINDVAVRVGSARAGVLAALTVSRLRGRNRKLSDVTVQKTIKQTVAAIERSLGIHS